MTRREKHLRKREKDLKEEKLRRKEDLKWEKINKKEQRKREKRKAKEEAKQLKRQKREAEETIPWNRKSRQAKKQQEIQNPPKKGKERRACLSRKLLHIKKWGRMESAGFRTGFIPNVSVSTT